MKHELTWHVKRFNQLTLDELYQIIKLRSDVFVVEQDCVYLDADGKDVNALHVFGVAAEKIRAYARLFKPGDYFEDASIGRVVVPKDDRKYGYGHELMGQAITAAAKVYNAKKIQISAQTYLKDFYQGHGFEQVGEPYLEDGIPHIGMVRQG